MNAGQASLFESPVTQGAHRSRDPRTSVDAARSVDVGRQRDILLRELRSVLCGATADELEDRTGIARYVVAARLAQMRRDKTVEPFGVRENRHGRRVQIWFALATPREVDVPVAGGRL